MRTEHETELRELHQKMEAEKQTKAKMQQEVELMKQQYEEKLKALENRRVLSRANSTVDPVAAAEANQLQQRQQQPGKSAGNAAAAAAGIIFV